MKPGKPSSAVAAALILLVADGAPTLVAREWTFTGIPKPMEAEFVAMKNGGVVLRGPNGKSFEVPVTSFSQADQNYLRLLEAGGGKTPDAGKPVTTRSGYKVRSVESLANQVVTLSGSMELHVTGTGDPVAGCTFHFTSPDGWLFFDNIAPSVVEAGFLDRMLVNGSQAVMNQNLRVVRYESGTVVIPHGPDFPAMMIYEGKDLAGLPTPLKCHIPYNGATSGTMRNPVGSFMLKRGYMATLARQENGTGASVNYVAQDHDVEVGVLPKGLDDGIHFIRIFPWRWTGKKGIAGGIWQNLNVSWFYDWNISTNSTADMEYVPIAQKIGWPNLNQDWQKRGATHLLGFNEPDHKDQANLKVDDAIKAWPSLLASGLRVGAPAVSDGGLNWLYEFMDKADAAGLRVDFVPVHYYRATADPGDARGAADQFQRFLKGIHDRVKRPLWVTEWNNGANWTTAPDPDEKQQKAAIAAMIKMLDDTPFVERYALYNWVEDARQAVRKDGSLTPAGEVYRDKKSPLSYLQSKGGK